MPGGSSTSTVSPSLPTSKLTTLESTLPPTSTTATTNTTTTSSSPTSNEPFKLRDNSANPTKAQPPSPKPMHSYSQSPPTSPRDYTSRQFSGSSTASSTRTIDTHMPRYFPSTYSHTASSNAAGGEAMQRQSSSGSVSSTRAKDERTEWERIACGRHSGDWIFGGHSISDAFKGFFRKQDGPHEPDQ